jgi:hypothetical protein
MDDLADQYRGRIRVARVMAMTADLQIVAPELHDRYDLTYMPTVILFDKGKEVMRWRLVVLEDVYRHDLDDYLRKRFGAPRALGTPAR